MLDIALVSLPRPAQHLRRVLSPHWRLVCARGGLERVRRAVGGIVVCHRRSFSRQ